MRLVLSCFLVFHLLALSAAEPLGPGKHSKLVCDGAADETWDAYVPKAAEDPTARLPVLFISGPGGNPGFMGVDKWAEREGVVLVTINRSKNGPSEPIMASQAAVIAAADARLRLHPCLRFAMGMSGAAQASWLLVGNRPQQSAGVLMMGQAGFDSPFPAKHISVAYLHGEKEPNLSFIDDYFGRLKSAGNPVRRTVVPGGHVSGSAEDRVVLLDWMLAIARLGHPGLSAEERKRGESLFTTRIDALASIADVAEREAAALRLLDLPPIQARPVLLKKTEAIWRVAAFAHATASTDQVARAAGLLPLSTDPRLKGTPEAAQIAKLLPDLRKDAACRSEFEAWAAWQQYSPQVATARGESARKKLSEILQQLAQRWPATAGAKAAEAALSGLSAAKP
jgi:hypothetical protein